MTAETVFFILGVIFILCGITLIYDLPQLLPVFLCAFFIVLIANLDTLLEKQCTNCSVINFSGNDYCQTCGEELKIEKEKEEQKSFDDILAEAISGKYPLRCKDCNKSFKEGLNYCDDCGKPLTPAKEVKEFLCAECDAVIHENDKFCMYCGKELDKQ